VGTLLETLQHEGCSKIACNVIDDLVMLLSECKVKTVRAACARALGQLVQPGAYKAEQITQLLLKVSCTEEFAEVRAGAVASLKNAKPAITV
jgi:hypothetical protein